MSEATVTFGAKDKNLKSTITGINKEMGGMKKTTTATAKRVDMSFKSMAKAGAVAGASMAVMTKALDLTMQGLRGVSRHLSQSITDASDFGETVSKIGQIFGESSGDIEEWAGTSAKALGQSSTQAMDAAAQFAIFGKSAGLVGDDLVGFSTELTELSADLASFNNVSPEDAITAIGSALRGEAEPMRKFGVLLDAATLSAAALEMGLISSIKTALTPQQKVLAAHSVILKQTSDQQGDFARTSGGLANQQRILSAQMTNVSTSLGQAFLPIMTKLVVLLNDSAIPLIASFAEKMEGMGDGEWVNNTINGIKDMAKVLMGAFQDPMGAIKLIGLELAFIAKQLGNDIIHAFKFAWEASKSIFESDLPNMLLSKFKMVWDVFLVLGKAAIEKLRSSEAVNSFAAAMNAAWEKGTTPGKGSTSGVAAVIGLGLEAKAFVEGEETGFKNDLSNRFNKFKEAGKAANKEIAIESKKAIDEIMAKAEKEFSGSGKKMADELNGAVKGVNVEKVDYFGAGEAMGAANEAAADLKKRGEDFAASLKEGAESADKIKERSKDLPNAGAGLKDGIDAGEEGMVRMVKEAKKLAKELGFAAKLGKRIQDFKNEGRKGRELKAKAEKAMNEGNMPAARRAQRMLQEREADADLRGVGDNRDRRHLQDIAEAEGVIKFGRTDKEIRDDILWKRKLEEEQAARNKKGGINRKGKGAKAAEKPKENKLERLAGDIFTELKSIGKKLPTHALGV